MSLILNGTDGLSDVDGTAATPAIRGTDANTGIFFGTDIIGFSEGGVEAARINADAQFVAAAGTALLPVITTTGDTNTGIFFPAADTIAFSEGGVESMRIDTSGSFLINTTTSGSLDNSNSIVCNPNLSGGLTVNHLNGTGSGVIYARFGYNAGVIGSITQSGTTAVAYNTSSDYRLKHDIQPMTGALAKVAALKPVTYKWNADDSDGQGFIAHELQAVVPDCVTGEKDAVETVDDLDAEGRKIGTKEVPRYQGVDTSFLVATLVAAIQELKAEFDAYKATHP